MQLQASWIVVGTVTEKRELTSEKNKDWRGYVCKLATIGLTAEVQLTPEQFAQVGQGESLRLSGRFEMSGHAYRLITEKVEPAK